MEALPEPLSGDQNRGPTFLIVALLFCGFALLFVLLRLFVRIRRNRSTGWDDYLILLAMALSITTAAFNIMAVQGAFGQHKYYLSLSNAITAIKYAILSEATFSLSLASSKLSICLFLLSIIRNSVRDKSKRFFLYFTMGLLFVTTVICVSQLLGQCRPAPKLWNPTVPGTCEDPAVQEKFGYFNGVVAAWVDFSLAAFPISFVKDLQLSTKNKVALCSLLSFGVFAGVCAVIRTTLESSLSSRADLTWDLVDAAVWAIVETNMSIIVACVPTFKPLYVSLIGKFTSRKQSHRFIADDDEARRHDSRTQGFYNLEVPYALTIYPSSTQGSGAKEISGSERELRSDAGMPGVT